MKSTVRLLLTGVFCLFFSELVFSQEIVTASQYFNQVSDRYGAVTDYQAHVNIIQGKTPMEGTLYYRSPNKIRIDFSNPKDQVINSNGKTLTVYLPRYNVGFTQPLKKRSDAAIAALASKQGLNLLKSSYSIAYDTGPEPVALDDKNPEKVVKLKLTWRSGSQTFRQLDIAVSTSGYIRRITGLTAGQTTVQYDFSNIKTNIGIPDSRFDYDTPPTANVIRNFLFEPEG